jgi:glycerophosphoryl diester phosphodiesterase
MTKIVSHRGAAGLALENSLESIKASLELPIYAIEIDVRITRDGQLVLLHDWHTGRVSGQRLLVSDVTLAELRKLKLNNGEQIPTLEEIFKLVGDKKTLMMDIKGSGTVDEILRLLRAYPEVKAFCSGRQYGDLRKIHHAMPNVKFLVQHHFDPMEIIHHAKMLGAQGICLNMWLMNPLSYRLAKEAGLEIYVYTINHRWILRFFQKLYPDAIVISNNPDRML